MENNFNKEIENFKKDTKSKGLSYIEKSKLKNRIYSEIGIKNPSYGYHIFKVSVAFVVAFLIVGGPVVYASNNSLPGDKLYSIKTNVNEKAVAVFVPDNEYSLKLAKKRMTELESLIEKEEVDEKKLNIIEKKLVTYREEIVEDKEADITVMGEYLNIIETYNEVSNIIEGEVQTEIDIAILETEDKIESNIAVLAESEIDNLIETHVGVTPTTTPKEDISVSITATTMIETVATTTEPTNIQPVIEKDKLLKAYILSESETKAKIEGIRLTSPIKPKEVNQEPKLPLQSEEVK